VNSVPAQAWSKSYVRLDDGSNGSVEAVHVVTNSSSFSRVVGEPGLVGTIWSLPRGATVTVTAVPGGVWLPDTWKGRERVRPRGEALHQDLLSGPSDARPAQAK
jgi:hypothetical protein